MANANAIASANASRRGHSRRQSLEVATESGSQPPSPMTYFPPPSSYSVTQPHLSASPVSTTGTLPSMPIPSYPSSTSMSSSDDIRDRGGLTPRVPSQSFDSATSSPKARRNSTLGPSASLSFGESRRQHAHAHANANANAHASGGGGAIAGGVGRTMSTPVESLNGLGLGNPVRRDDALSSPRRISTSHPIIPSTSHPHVSSSSSHQHQLQHPHAASLSHTAHAHAHGRPRAQSPAALLLPSIPTNEAYYSQPPSATTPRFRRHQHSRSAQYGSFRPSMPAHARRPSNSSQIPLIPKSPASSVFRTLRKTASTVGISLGGQGEYDADEDADDVEQEDEDEGKRANGTRVWYRWVYPWDFGADSSSFVTIDWIHDAIKESSRVRRLRHNAKRSLSGSIANSWDRFQGWFVVTVIGESTSLAPLSPGVVSAVIAFMITRSEMALFDLKEGFCTTSWGTAKRFCCAPHRSGPTSPGGDDEVCGDWMEWGQFFGRQRERNPQEWVFGEAEFITYAIIALTTQLVLAGLASCLTVYLSSSAHHTTSKDSTFIAAPATPIKNPERQPLLPDTPVPGSPNSFAKPADPPRKVMYYAAGSGIPEIKTILSGFVIHGYLGGWTLLTKSVGLALSVASGLSLGKEGPLVHMSSCVGNIVSRLFVKFEHNEAKRREVLSAACAAGVAVAFGAPIGGVLFSLEEVSYYFPPKVMWRSFWCAAVAAITLKWLNPFGNGSLFAVTYTKQYHYWEFGIFILLGVFGGIYGAVFSRLNILWSRHVRQGTWLGRHPIIEVLLVTALTTVVSFLNPYCRMGGTELVASLFAECKPDSSSSLCVDRPSEIYDVIWTVGTALVIKGCLTIVTFGIKLPAGIFIPSLVVGACFGRVVGLFLEYVQSEYPYLNIFDVCTDTNCIVPGLYAMIGAAATLAGVTRTTVSLAVIVIELTNTLNYVVPVMLSVLVAKTVADGLEKKGIYDLVIDLNGLPYLDSKHEHLWGGRRVSEVAETQIPTLRADRDHTVRSLTGRLLELVRTGMTDTGFPVLVKDRLGAGGAGPSGEMGGDERGVLRWGVIYSGILGVICFQRDLCKAELADEPDATLNLMPEDRGSHPRSSVMSIFSFADSFHEPGHNPYDMSRYIDRAPITVQVQSPLELVQQLFVKLGARQLLVVDARGVYRGMVTKKSWLRFLDELDAEGH
ncbi:Probable chloride channel protein UM03490-D [Saitozyma sp. JCM 24511]|nr:Probable chloride channel protein UM03490-D [Saitozyma sp. JCM 24511]